MNGADASDAVVVVSAVNVFNAGPLSIVRDFLAALLDQRRREGKRWRLILIAHRASLYADLGNDLEIVEFPASRRTWFHRIYYEYLHFYLWSRRLPIYGWLSLHDLTPSVRALHRVVYCHHATPFYNGPSSRISREWRFGIQRRLYSLFYSINIHKNDFVVVQQQWLRNAFMRRFRLGSERVIVCTPSVQVPAPEPVVGAPKTPLLIYPAFPRFFKNVEILLDAVKMLPSLDFRLVLTIQGDENDYARAIRLRATSLPQVELRGLMSRGEVFALYRACHALVFPSRLESFGLPLKEIQSFHKPVFAADLPYAHEALSGYEQACFFDPDDAQRLARLLSDFLEHGRFAARRLTVDYDPPYAGSWRELITFLEQHHVLP